MGAPRNLDEVEIFLKNMFNDKNIITVKSDLLRRLISFFITSSRKNEAKKSYEKVGGASPLVKETKLLLQRVKEVYKDDEVINIMRYTPPFAKESIKELQQKGISDVVLFPLYPHYSTTTVKSSLEDFYNSAKELGFDPAIKVIEPFYKNPLYNKAVLKTIKEALKEENSKEFDLILSAHSLPLKIVKNGDIYPSHVNEHIDILKELLKNEGMEFRDIHLAYQSKLGPIPWLEPNLEEVLKTLTDRRVLIVPISFVLDNSETLFELDKEYRELSRDLGYEKYLVASCPNSSDSFIEFIKGVVE
jgi:ferrochelatase